jgi:hypothetical protein
MVKELLVKKVLKPGELIQFRVFINLSIRCYEGYFNMVNFTTTKTLKYLYPHLNYAIFIELIHTTRKIFVFL